MMVEATLQRPRIWSTTEGIVLAILAAVAIWCLGPMSPIMFALTAVVALFLFGLKRPLWAMAAFMVSQLTVTSYMINNPLGIPISLRLSLLLLIGIFLLRSRMHEKIKFGTKAKQLLVPALVLLGLIEVSNLIHSGFDYAFKDFRTMLAGILVIIFLPAVVRNMKEFKILCSVVFIGVTASAIIGLIQHYQFFGLGLKTLIPGFLQQWGDQLRVPGMAETELELSYTLAITALAVLGIFLARGLNSNTRKLLLPSSILMAIALYFTYTRSALMALVLGLAALAILLKTRIKWPIILAVSLLFIAFIEMSGLFGSTFLGGREQAAQADSAYERKVLWQASIAIALDNPVLGIGGDQFKAVSPQYSSSVDPDLMRIQEQYWSYRTLGSQDPHNDFIMVWALYGTPALLAYLWLFFAILRNFHDSYRVSSSRLIKGLSVGLAAGLVAYGVNSFYHNCLATFPLFWILAGFSVTIAKLAPKTKEHTQIPRLPTGASS